MHGSKQIFQADTQSRWNRFIWTIRISGFIFIVISSLVVIDLMIMPKIMGSNEIYKKSLDPNTAFSLQSKHIADFQNVKRDLQVNNLQLGTPIECVGFCPIPHLKSQSKIRAGFYVNWDKQSFNSLSENIQNLNVVVPEWFFISDNSDSIHTKIDVGALAIMQQNRVKILPMISNFYDGKWNNKIVEEIIISRKARDRFIQSILYTLEKYDLQGINLNIQVQDNSLYNLLKPFQSQLFSALHEKGYLVTTNLNPLQSSYNHSNLSEYNDFIFVLAYNQHSPDTQAGPIGEQEWIQNIIESVTQDIPKYQIILVISNIGYDWSGDNTVKDVHYNDAINTAERKKSKINFDPNHYNLNYRYYDSTGIEHHVFFTDAGSNYQTAKLASEFGLSNFALWRIGTEDKRIWKFFNQEVHKTALIDNGPEVAFKPIDETKRTTTKHRKKVVLTFDDGPDETFTPKVLEILKKEKISATFFVTGMKVENNIPLLERIFAEGHEIGNHTFTHPNLLKVSDKRAEIELRATKRLIECILGYSTKLYRPPFSTDKYSKEWVEIRKATFGEESYYRIESTIDTRDWEKGSTANQILERLLDDLDEGSIILLHDGGGDRTETLKALPMIIKELKKRGYSFTSLSNFMGKNKLDLMPPLSKDQDFYLAYSNNVIAHGIFWGQNILTPMFILGILLAIGRILVVAILALIQKGKTKLEKLNLIDKPFVSIIVPAYNEEVNIGKSLDNLLQLDYPNFEIVFVDDGSKDNTFKVVQELFEGNPKLKIHTKQNGGKANALNYGIERCQGDYVICIDADTQLQADAVTNLMKYFTDVTVGAVGGNVKVGNEAASVITRWQSLEYITSQNFDKRAYDLMNCITVIPGAIGAFRKDVFIEVGRFTTDTLAEDCDLTIRVLKAGYKVRYSNTAIALTESPESVAQFLKQRYRWGFGILQSFWKHKDACFNPRYKALGLFALPNMLVFQMILPMFIPLADIVMILAMASGNAMEVLIYYFAFFFVEAVGAVIAFSLEGEDKRKIIWLLPQRLIYRYYMFWVQLRSIMKAIKGELMGWGVLKRTGNVPNLAGNKST